MFGLLGSSRPPHEESTPMYRMLCDYEKEQVWESLKEKLQSSQAETAGLG